MVRSTDWVKLAIPDYPKIVKKPMDLSTMRAKLDSGAYATAEKFRDDIKLVINNCFLYNPLGTPVHQAGLDLRKLFEEKWKGLPLLRVESEDEEDDDSDDDKERSRAHTFSIVSNCCLLILSSHYCRHRESNRNHAQQYQRIED
jgi:hypothetical protein